MHRRGGLHDFSDCENLESLLAWLCWRVVPDGLVGPLAHTQVELTARLTLIRQRATLQQPVQCAVLTEVLS